MPRERVNPDHDDFVGLSQAQIWERVDDQTFDEDLLCEPYESDPRPEIERLSRRTWPSWPTLVHEVAEARAGLTVMQCVGLALRAHRRRLGLSQRALAEELGVSQSSVARIESDAGRVPLRRVVEVLEAVGFELRLADPADWLAADLVARDSAGRRLPANGRVTRVTGPYRYEGRVDGAPVLWRWTRQ